MPTGLSCWLGVMAPWSRPASCWSPQPSAPGKEPCAALCQWPPPLPCAASAVPMGVPRALLILESAPAAATLGPPAQLVVDRAAELDDLAVAQRVIAVVQVAVLEAAAAAKFSFAFAVPPSFAASAQELPHAPSRLLHVLSPPAFGPLISPEQAFVDLVRTDS